MNQDEIIRMAREAGFIVIIHGESFGYTTLESRFNPDKLGDFAHLVAAHEREKQAEQEPCKECGAKQAQIDRLMLEYCPDEMTPEQMQEWEKNIKPFVEPVKQEPVAWVSEDVCDGQFINGRKRRIWWECMDGKGMAIYAAPVSIEAADIRARNNNDI